MVTDKAACTIITDALASHGVADAVCSPGSRNAPLLLAAEEEKRWRKHVVVDERSAAFIALGMAATTGRPVALICTSGTALLNYAPAVAEAYYRALPLIVVSADRPREWIDQDDSQTLRQFEALSNFVKKSYDVPDTKGPQAEWYASRIANDAMITALTGRQGPVHINVQLDAPLTSQGEAPRLREPIRVITGEDKVAQKAIEILAEEARDKKILVIAGFLAPDAGLSLSLRRFATLPNVFIMSETIANLKAVSCCDSIDPLLSSLPDEVLESMKPDIVITIGGALVSRFVKAWLRKMPHAAHWMVGHSHTTVDCFQSLTTRIEAAPAPFFRQLGGALRKHDLPQGYSSEWQRLNKLSKKAHSLFLESKSESWSDLKAFSVISRRIPAGYNVHFSNGTPIRYAQLFPAPQANSCWCNRGVSGIDGCTSTAIGSAIVAAPPTLLISGDMSFSYDIGALACHEIPDSFRAIVINNSGGEIFRFIPTTRNLPERERYFSAPPALQLSDLARAYGFSCSRVSDMAAIENGLTWLFNHKGKAMLEIITPPEINSRILTEYLNIKI